MNPWDQLESETSLAYRAFVTYLELGPGRSIDEAYRRDRDKPEAKQASGHFNAWAQDNSWFDRAQAWDAHDLAERMAARETVRERARQIFLDNVEAIAQRQVDIALGNKVFVDKVIESAIQDALDRAGITKPKDATKLELGAGDGGPVTITVQIGAGDEG